MSYKPFQSTRPTLTTHSLYIPFQLNLKKLQTQFFEESIEGNSDVSTKPELPGNHDEAVVPATSNHDEAVVPVHTDHDEAVVPAPMDSETPLKEP